jgi:hypothetical protein
VLKAILTFKDPVLCRLRNDDHGVLQQGSEDVWYHVCSGARSFEGEINDDAEIQHLSYPMLPYLVKTVDFCRILLQNVREAALWYAKAARQNHTKAQFNLAVCYQVEYLFFCVGQTALRTSKALVRQIQSESLLCEHV